MVRRRAALFVVVLLAVGACGGRTFERSDAINALVATGLSEVESTCVADTLVALGELVAADPGHRRGDGEREALVVATTRCVAPEPIARTSSQASDQIGEDDDPEGTPMNEPVSTPTTADLDERRASALAHLELTGRSRENARCIVDQLISMDADALLSDPAFGLGLDPIEADAFAACL